MSRTHTLKINPDLFAAVLRREKTAEIRRNDRDYQVGDTLILYPYDQVNSVRVGTDECWRTVSHILPGGQFGIEPGYVLLSMR